ncbi:FAD-dependent monooxygenase [Streptomyces griseofuscus]|uniref:FAD-dependent monooxygenase n=2 Tax=Streptomyces griseofuscus TaxID=146922 RepID=UPI002467ADCB|nr:FAD-dependent monooxygenase [Streptomyces griseofuscus]
MFFPAGGQGMNLGIQDATNLGWKMAATLQGRAPEGLLDSYDTERGPAARAVIDTTRAQLVLFAAASPEQIALREVWSAALAEPRTNRQWARRIAGFDDPLPADSVLGAHPLDGTRLAGLALEAAEASTAHPLMHRGRPLLLDLEGTRTPCSADGLEQRAVSVDTEASDRIWRGATAVLIRPDARVAWAATDTDPQRRAAYCRTALRTLCRRACSVDRPAGTAPAHQHGWACGGTGRLNLVGGARCQRGRRGLSHRPGGLSYKPAGPLPADRPHRNACRHADVPIPVRPLPTHAHGFSRTPTGRDSRPGRP